MTAEAIHKRLEHARAAGLLTSYDGAFLYDGSEVTVLISPENMHPSERANFACEREVLDLLVARSVSLHRADSIPVPADKAEK